MQVHRDLEQASQVLRGLIHEVRAVYINKLIHHTSLVLNGLRTLCLRSDCSSMSFLVEEV